MATHVTPYGAFLTATEEALVPTRYKDLVDVDTWGIGHTAAAGDPDPRTMSYAMPAYPEKVYEEAWAVFLDDLAAYAEDIRDELGDDLEPHELDGLTMWHFNTGGAFTSRAMGLWRAGDKEGACRVILQWNKVTLRGKKVVSEALKKRREDEVNLILEMRYPRRTLPIYPTNGRGRVIWEPTEVFTYETWKQFIGFRDEGEGKPPIGASVDNPISAIIAGLVAAAATVGAAISAWTSGWF